MKKLIFSFLLFLPLQIIRGQDKIITIQNDTIHCRIVSVSPAYVQYEQKSDNQHVIGKFIPTEQVSAYWRSPQPVDSSPYQRAVRGKAPQAARPLLIGIQAGGSLQLASADDSEKEMMDMGVPKSQLSDYFKKIKRGIVFKGDIHYLFSDYFGLGVHYSIFSSGASQDFKIPLPAYIPEYIYLGWNEKEYIHYAGLSAVFRQWLDKNRKFQLTENVSAGYVHYRDELRIDKSPYIAFNNGLAKSNTWGANAGLSADYYLLPWLSVNANSSFMYARLTKVKLSTKYETQTIELEKNDYEYLTRFDYSIGIRFLF